MADTLAELTLGRDAGAVPQARRFAREHLDLPPEQAADAELVLSELVTNAVLHGEPPVAVRLAPLDGGVRIEVRDAGRTPPILVTASPEAMTGRGLSLVAALSSRWGVDPVPGAGKAVWAELTGTAEAASPPHGDAPADIEALLAAWADDERAEQVHTIRLGPVATRLLVAAKAHVDNVVRELALLRQAHAADGVGLPPDLAEMVEVITGDFAAARTELKREAAAAAAKGQPITDVVLHLPARVAEAGERYLAALDEVDRFARASQMLSLAPPVEHRLFRQWYVTNLVEQLRALDRGQEPPAPEPLQLVYAAEVGRTAPLVHTAARLSLLQRVNSALADAASPVEMAEAVVTEALSFLPVETVRVRLLDDDGMLRSVAWKGRSGTPRAGVDAFPLDSDLPGAVAARSRRPVLLRSLTESFRTYPELAEQYRPDRSGHLVPLVAGDRVLGLMILTFAAGELSDDVETAFVTSLADALAHGLVRAELAAADAEQRATLGFLAEASQILISERDPGDVLARLAELAVPRLADWCAVYALSDDGTALQRVAMAVHGHPEVAERGTGGRLGLDEDVPQTRAYRSGHAQTIPSGIGRLLERLYPGLDFAALGGDRDGGSGVSLPIVLRGEVIGAIGVTFLRSGRRISPATTAALQGLADRAAVALDNARRFRAQAEMVQALAAALLPAQPPVVEGLRFAARYLPAAGDVAGDWWEASELADGSVLLGLGDAAGHGVAAVSDMCQLRHGARALAAVESSPAALLADLNRRLSDPDAALATAVYGRFDPGTGRLTWANAGHMPPLRIAADGRVEVLGAPGTPLGSPGEAVGSDATLTLAAGDTLVLYSDGVVERRHEDLADGIARLTATVAGSAHQPLEALADVIVDAHCDHPVDDCCLLLVRRV